MVDNNGANVDKQPSIKKSRLTFTQGRTISW